MMAKINLQIGKRTDNNTRIATGIRQTTIDLPGGPLKRIPASHQWRGQANNFLELSKVLERSGTKLTQLSINTNPNGTAAYNAGHDRPVTLISFVATVPGGSFIWQKYEGGTAGGGQNWVYAAGQKLKLTTFLELSYRKQAQLLRGNRITEKQIEANRAKQNAVGTWNYIHILDEGY